MDASPRSTPGQPDRRIIAVLGVIFLGGVLLLATTAAHSGTSGLANDNGTTLASVLPPGAFLTLTPPINTVVPTQAATSTVVATVPPTQGARGVGQVTTPQATTAAGTALPTSLPATVIPTAEATAHLATVVPTATLTESQTPLQLTDPVGSATAVAAPPWWQTTLDIAWKLALVVGLIVLAMRVLAAMKSQPWRLALGRNGAAAGAHFFEKLEEIRLSPQHTLVAVRAGSRIYVFTQSGNTLRPVGDLFTEDELTPAEPGEEQPEASTLPAPQTNFGSQVRRAWAGMLTPGQPAAPEPPPAPPTPDVMPGAVDANWVTVEADVQAPPVPSPAAPRRGVARAADKAPPEVLEPAREREILWFAEEQGVSAAAAKFGLTRQRVTAMRQRYERERRPPSPTSTGALAAPASRSPSARPAPERPPQPDVAESAPTRPPLLAAKAHLARATYAPAAAPHPVPVAQPPTRPSAARAKPPTDDEIGAQAAQVARDLARRLGLEAQIGMN